MNKYNFTTVVSSYYLYKFLVMYQSLKHHSSKFTLFVMCVEEEVFNILKDMKLSSIILLKCDDIKNNALKEARANRSYLEYCWLLKSVTLFYVMENYKDADYYAHLDADLCFFGNPELIFNERPDASLFLTDHNNSQRFLQTYETSGRFNTGFVGCKKDRIARKALEWWQERCFESCSPVADITKKIFGDQRYVEKWTTMFGNTHIIKSKGVNVAVWNIEGYKVKLIDKNVFVDKDRLIFYHFSGFSIINKREFSLTYFYPITKEPLNLIYLPYMQLLNENIQTIKKQYPSYDKGFVDSSRVSKVHCYKIEA